MKVLVLGSGGREHALVWKLRQSPRVSKLYCAPGNGGIADEAECLPVDLKSVDSMVALGAAAAAGFDRGGSGTAADVGSGGRIRAARLAGVWADEGGGAAGIEQELRQRISAAASDSDGAYAICDSMEEVREALAHFHVPVVVKADGLAAGKGVVIAASKEEAAVRRRRRC